MSIELDLEYTGDCCSKPAKTLMLLKFLGKGETEIRNLL